MIKADLHPRIRKLTGSLLLALFIATLAIVSFGGGLSITILVSIFPNFEDFPKFIPASTTWLVSSALVDAIITGTLIITLYRKRTGIEVTDSVLNKIIIFTVQTGLLTAIFALADAILFLALPGTGINFIPDFALSKLYTNTFLASLNARADRGALMGKPKGQVYVTGNTESRTRPISMSAGQTCFTTITSPLDITGNMSMLRPEDDNKTPRRFTLEDMDIESGRRPKQ
ncbi:hypothetical protein ONZ45_g10791 [Pleurotus djamor]|nr:hypothetical protein ONZ45_g10791 [Pleurotus djamor]